MNNKIMEMDSKIRNLNFENIPNIDDNQNSLNSNFGNRNLSKNFMPAMNQQQKSIDTTSFSSHANDCQSLMQFSNLQRNLPSYSLFNDLAFNQAPQSSFVTAPPLPSPPLSSTAFDYQLPSSVHDYNNYHRRPDNFHPLLFENSKICSLPNKVQNYSPNGKSIDNMNSMLQQMMINNDNHNNATMAQGSNFGNNFDTNTFAGMNFLNDLSGVRENKKPISMSAFYQNDLEHSMYPNNGNISSASGSSSSERNYFDAISVTDNNNKLALLGNSGTLNIDKFIQMSKLIMRGFELAERVAYIHRHRPCFRKIDSLCARMKQDLLRTDGVLSNINSQGIAWAVKDFIFVFTRIMNGWIIIKGYVYDTPEELNKVKAALSSDFEKIFFEWQNVTYNFAVSLIRSFVSLNQLFQSQKMQHRSQSTEQSSTNTSPMSAKYETLNNQDFSMPNYNLFDESLDLLLMCSSDGSFSGSNNANASKSSEENQHRMGTHTNGNEYLRTGVYDPMGNDLSTNVSQESLNFFKMDKMKTTEEGAFSSPEFSPINTTSSTPRKTSQFSNDYYSHSMIPNTNSNSQQTGIFDLLINRIATAATEGGYFFSLNFARNYFPDFIKTYPHLIDLRSITIKIQAGAYTNIFEIVHDLKLISFYGRMYLKKHNDEFLEKTLNSYETGIDSILKSDIFRNYNFDHITGNPNEVFFIKNYD